MEMDCIDICEIVCWIMCKHCPHAGRCTNDDNEINHDQMAHCLYSGVLANPSDPELGKWPNKLEDDN